MLTGKNYAVVALYVGVTSLAAKQVCLGPVKRAQLVQIFLQKVELLPTYTPIWFVARQIWFMGGKTSNIAIECFHRTSRRSYWIFQNNETAVMWCPKPILPELNSFLMQTSSFANKFAYMLATLLKRLYSTRFAAKQIPRFPCPLYRTFM